MKASSARAWSAAFAALFVFAITAPSVSARVLPTATEICAAGGGPPTSPESSPAELPGSVVPGQAIATTEPW